jgi:hypothetical protein
MGDAEKRPPAGSAGVLHVRDSNVEHGTTQTVSRDDLLEDDFSKFRIG